MATASPFAMTVPEKGGGKYELIPADNHEAVCVAVIDLGTHTEQYGDRSNTSRKVFLVWELVNCKASGTNDSNHLIGERYTLSFNEKARLADLIKSWRGKALEPKEKFDVARFAGLKCMLNVIHKPSKSDPSKVYANIAGVSKPHPKVVIDDAQHDAVTWWIGCGADLPDWLPYCFGEKVEDIVARSEEMNSPRAGAAPSGPAPADDEIPF